MDRISWLSVLEEGCVRFRTESRTKVIVFCRRLLHELIVGRAVGAAVNAHTGAEQMRLSTKHPETMVRVVRESIFVEKEANR